MKKECAYCGIDMGEIDGKGVEGTTSGICEECLNIERLLLARGLVKNHGLTWPKAKKRLGIVSHEND